MVVRPSSKCPDVGVIPDEWEVVELKGLADIQRGASPRPIGSPSWYDKNSNVGWVRISDVSASDGKYLKRTDDYFSQKGISRSRYLPSGSLIMSICATVGMPVITKIDACIHDGFVGFTKIQRADQEFLYYKLKQLEPAFKSMGQTGSQANLNSELVRICKVALPHLPEQRAIATTLSDVDIFLAKLDQLIVKKHDFKQAAMQQLLTGKKRLPGFSGEWGRKALDELFTFSGGLSASREQLSEKGYCYLHYGDIHGSTKTYVDVRSEYQDIPKLDIPIKRVSTASLLEDGDVVFVDASEDDEGASRHVVIVNTEGIPFISGLHTIVAKDKGNDLAHQYRRYCFQTTAVKAQFRYYAVGTKVTGISKTNIAKIVLPVPSLPEQSAIAAVLSDMDAEIAELERNVAKTRLIKQGMMQELLTGKIRIV